jgi:alpha-tubulin suppressor-like RCC1 family protein
MKSLASFNLNLILSVFLFANITRAVTPLPVTDISGGESHTLVLGENGQAFGCGFNGDYQLGIGHDLSNQLTLVRVHGPNDEYVLENIYDVEAGWTHSLAIDSNETVWAWGVYSKSLSNRAKAVLGFTPQAFDHAINSVMSTRLLEDSQL